MTKFTLRIFRMVSLGATDGRMSQRAGASRVKWMVSSQRNRIGFITWRRHSQKMIAVRAQFPSGKNINKKITCPPLEVGMLLAPCCCFCWTCFSGGRKKGVLEPFALFWSSQKFPLPFACTKFGSKKNRWSTPVPAHFQKRMKCQLAGGGGVARHQKSTKSWIFLKIMIWP